MSERLVPPRSIEILEDGQSVLDMTSSLPLPDALRWAADVLEGKAGPPAEPSDDR